LVLLKWQGWQQQQRATRRRPSETFETAQCLCTYSMKISLIQPHTCRVWLL
jgi:hypothetical protein